MPPANPSRRFDFAPLSRAVFRNAARLPPKFLQVKRLARFPALAKTAFMQAGKAGAGNAGCRRFFVVGAFEPSRQKARDEAVAGACGVDGRDRLRRQMQGLRGPYDGNPRRTAGDDHHSAALRKQAFAERLRLRRISRP